jgi:hypothetical protein
MTRATLRERMIDETIEAYVVWREECVRVWEAYQRWVSAVRSDAAGAFMTYTAAIDREERASEVYAARISRLEPLLATSHGNLGSGARTGSS